MFEGDIHKDLPDVVSTETVNNLFDVIVSAPATVSPDSNLRDALDAIVSSGVTRKAYVVDEEGRLRGTITVETLMRHAAYRLGARPPGVISWFRFLRDMEGDQVTDFMVKPVPVTKETTLVEIVRRVVEEHLNDFPVVDGEGKLLGEVNTHNLLKHARSVFPDQKPGE